MRYECFRDYNHIYGPPAIGVEFSLSDLLSLAESTDFATSDEDEQEAFYNTNGVPPLIINVNLVSKACRV